MFASIKLYAYAGIFAAALALLAFAHHRVFSAGVAKGEAIGAKIASKAEVARLNAEAVSLGLAVVIMLSMNLSLGPQGDVCVGAGIVWLFNISRPCKPR